MRTFNQAKELFAAEDICVSTDDPDIVTLLADEGYEVPFIRPAVLATDEATTDDVIRHALSYYDSKSVAYDTVTLLQATSPFRRVVDIRNSISLYRPSIDMVVSVKETSSNPYYVLFEENGNGFLEKCKDASFGSRQECPKVWEYNGAIYVINAETIKKTDRPQMTKLVKYVMDEKHSIDIDTPLDWQFAEFMLSNEIQTLGTSS